MNYYLTLFRAVARAVTDSFVDAVLTARGLNDALYDKIDAGVGHGMNRAAKIGDEIATSVWQKAVLRDLARMLDLEGRRIKTHLPELTRDERDAAAQRIKSCVETAEALPELAAGLRNGSVHVDEGDRLIKTRVTVRGVEHIIVFENGRITRNWSGPTFDADVVATLLAEQKARNEALAQDQQRKDKVTREGPGPSP